MFLNTESSFSADKVVLVSTLVQGHMIQLNKAVRCALVIGKGRFIFDQIRQKHAAKYGQIPYQIIPTLLLMAGPSTLLVTNLVLGSAAP